MARAAVRRDDRAAGRGVDLLHHHPADLTSRACRTSRWIGTWCTLCLIAAASMLVQIPYSLDELVATTQFLWRRRKAGRPLLRVLMVGDSDEGQSAPEPEAFERAPRQVLRDMWTGGVNLPWNLAIAMAIGAFLMCSRLTLDAQDFVADAHHLVGSLVVTVAVIACAEAARTLRFGISLLGLALMITGYLEADPGLQLGASLACGAALVWLGLPRGKVSAQYGAWNRYIL